MSFLFAGFCVHMLPFDFYPYVCIVYIVLKLQLFVRAFFLFKGGGCKHTSLTLTVSILFSYLTECDGNTYGQDCGEECGECVNGEQCHHINGTCLNGCKPGYQGQQCNQGNMKYNQGNQGRRV